MPNKVEIIDHNCPKLHVDGSTIYYEDEFGFCHQSSGIGGFINLNNHKTYKFSKSLSSFPYQDYFEHYAIIEGLIWALNYNLNKVLVYTDSLECVKLFGLQKHNLSKKDKFFLSIFYAIELHFEVVSVEYYSRNATDLAHNLSRNHIDFIPKNTKLINNPTKELKNELELRYSTHKSIINKLLDYHTLINSKK